MPNKALMSHCTSYMLFLSSSLYSDTILIKRIWELCNMPVLIRIKSHSILGCTSVGPGVIAMWIQSNAYCTISSITLEASIHIFICPLWICTHLPVVSIYLSVYLMHTLQKIGQGFQKWLVILVAPIFEDPTDISQRSLISIRWELSTP